MTRTIIIGDIHGCWDELQALLAAAAPTRDDVIVAMGDIVDRGPASEHVLEFIHDTPGALSIMGNHERKHLRAAAGQTEEALSQRIVQLQLGDRYPAWLEFMASFPRHLGLPEAILVHGFFEPGVPLEQQRDTVVIGTLTGESYIHASCPDWVDRYDGPKPLVVAHHDYLRTGQPLIREGRFYAIDTGCVYGRRLTALVLPEFRFYSVPARQDYWAESRREYALLADPSTPDWDLGWDTLHDLAASAGRAGLPLRLSERADRCARIAQKCGQVAQQLIQAVQSLSASLVAQLRAAPDWIACPPRKQSARYAQRVDRHPAADLLYGARRGHLSEIFVQRRITTPRALFTSAVQLGIEVPAIDESA
jgi:serine/threonine protein phosphatase 1